MNNIQSSSPYEDENQQNNIITPQSQGKNAPDTADQNIVVTPPVTPRIPPAPVMPPPSKPQSVIGTIAYNKDQVRNEQQIYSGMDYNQGYIQNSSLLSDQVKEPRQQVYVKPPSDDYSNIPIEPIAAQVPPVQEPEWSSVINEKPNTETQSTNIAPKKKGSCCITWLIVIVFFIFFFLFAGAFLVLYARKNYVPGVTPFVENELEERFSFL